jgi:hypothetical protein
MVFDVRIEMMRRVASIPGCKLPRDGTTLPIARGFQRVDTPAQGSQTIHPTGEPSPLENADLDFSHIQPASMFGGGMKLDPLQDASGLFWGKSFIEGGRSMRIEIVLNDANIFRIGVGAIDQPRKKGSSKLSFLDLFNFQR